MQEAPEPEARAEARQEVAEPVRLVPVSRVRDASKPPQKRCHASALAVIEKAAAEAMREREAGEVRRSTRRRPSQEQAPEDPNAPNLPAVLEPVQALHSVADVETPSRAAEPVYYDVPAFCTLGQSRWGQLWDSFRVKAVTKAAALH